jgi:tetratricopeptide (TPR) repeat protein
MTLPKVKKVMGALLALMLLDFLALHAYGQDVPDESKPPVSAAGSLGFTPARAIELQRALDGHDYVAAEKLLLPEIDRDPHSARAARLLAFAGSVYFLNRDYINAAIAWKKSEAIAPLNPSLRFSLAMAYIHMGHSDWARKVLETLAAENGKEPLYPYWFGRLDYDGHEYNGAIRHFQHAIELAPGMARAYDNLGLCYYYQNQNGPAVENFNKAIEIGRASPHPSPWPYLNLAVTQQFLNQPAAAETNLREAVRLDPDFAQAHFQLGSVLDDLNHPEAAIAELREAARLDGSYAEPHMALARIYRRLGQETTARDEVQIYLRLHPHSTP